MVVRFTQKFYHNQPNHFSRKSPSISQQQQQQQQQQLNNSLHYSHSQSPNSISNNNTNNFQQNPPNNSIKVSVSTQSSNQKSTSCQVTPKLLQHSYTQRIRSPNIYTSTGTQAQIPPKVPQLPIHKTSSIQPVIPIASISLPPEKSIQQQSQQSQHESQSSQQKHQQQQQQNNNNLIRKSSVPITNNPLKFQRIQELDTDHFIEKAIDKVVNDKLLEPPVPKRSSFKSNKSAFSSIDQATRQQQQQQQQQ